MESSGTFALLSDPPSSRVHEAAWGLDAFGLRIRSDLPLVGAVPRVDGPAGADRRSLRISSFEADPLAHDGVTLLERRRADGSLGMRVARLGDESYLIEAPGHGTFHVAEDGSVVNYDRLADPAWRWHRPLCAQALPLAATLQGFELFHASAVVLAGSAVAFVAGSGTGKTSLAVALLARGAALVSDDVLALEASAGGVLAHPGVPLANIADDQLALLAGSARAQIGVPIGTSDKVHVEISKPAAGPLPLGAVFFLERSESVERLVVERVCPPEPRDLLGATFMPHIVTRGRLMTQLSICADIAGAVAIFRLWVPATLAAAHVAAEVERAVTEVIA